MNTALQATLLHSLWEGALIAVILVALLQICRSGSARLRYALACAGLFAIPLAFGVTFWLSLPPARPQVSIPATFPIARLLELPSTDSSAPGSSPSPTTWLVPLWMTGVLGFYLYSLAGWFSAQRLRRVGVCAAAPVWQERLGSRATRLRLSRQVILLESCLASTPVVIGAFRPVILVPLGILSGLPIGQVEAILTHELAHIRRHDYLVNLIQRFVEGLLFCHPAVWWISHQVRSEREFCCDDLVVEMSGDPRGYAQALSTLEQRRWTASEAALAANGGNLMIRIRRLLHRQESPRIAVAPVAGLLALLTCAALAAWQPTQLQQPRPQSPAPTAPVPMAQTKPEQPKSPAIPAAIRKVSPYRKWMDEEVGYLIAQAPPPQPQSPRPVAAPPPNPFQKWLNEEVVNIATDEEREAFGLLQSDEDRQQFIEQFWIRRDPTPGTNQNEYQEEHYRRIQWANDHFGGDQPGWRSDRGRVYIAYGPPDEVDTHTGATGTPVYEVWRYRYVATVGGTATVEFVDSARTGDFRLTNPPQGKLQERKRVF